MICFFKPSATHSSPPLKLESLLMNNYITVFKNTLLIEDCQNLIAKFELHTSLHKLEHINDANQNGVTSLKLNDHTNTIIQETSFTRHSVLDTESGIKNLVQDGGVEIMRDVLFRYENIQTKTILERKAA